MNRPEVICLMMTTVDGRILTENWGASAPVKALTKVFEKAHDSFGVPAWLCGRTTLEKDFTKGAKPVLKRGGGPVERLDFIGDRKAASFAIAIDGHGRLGWEKASLQGDHVVTILTEAVPDGYLAQLQEVGVSYLFAGSEELDLALALQKLYNLFGIKKLMLEGGGHINGSFLNAGLIDELNLLVLPLADGTAGSPSVFEITAGKKPGATRMELQDVRKMDEGVVWLRYRIPNS